ncbi:hypothetical protein C4D60_Mb06t08230 [Musa balbisiana]|uniref:BZIP domain-containing protein n=1 Tax=Musa balbisiana TaxID=52838 RepID=A0A4S8INY4_MUSBA|nr:hypothetical protein C4D60_Mb06t08230 [Musa balbisiana]
MIGKRSAICPVLASARGSDGLTRPVDPSDGGDRRAACRRNRQAHSWTFLRLPDDILFDTDPGFGVSDIDFPSLSDDNVSGGDAGAVGGGLSAEPRMSDQPAVACRPVPGAHLRSLSVGAAFFDSLGFQAGTVAGSDGSAQERKGHNRRNGSMSPFDGESTPLSDYAKKAMTTADKLAELALIDPKRAKRRDSLNRQSAARSKERKIHFTSELGMEGANSSDRGNHSFCPAHTSADLTAENREHKLQLQAMEQQAQLCDALNEAMREEVQRLKIATGQLPTANGNPLNGGLLHHASNYYSHPQRLPPLSGREAQHPHPSQTQSSSNETEEKDAAAGTDTDLDLASKSLVFIATGIFHIFKVTDLVVSAARLTYQSLYPATHSVPPPTSHRVWGRVAVLRVGTAATAPITAESCSAVALSTLLPLGSSSYSSDDDEDGCLLADDKVM